MQRYQRLGVYLNGEPGDTEALRFAGLVARLAGSKSIRCIYVPGIEDPPPPSLPEVAEVRERVLEAMPAEVADRTVIEVSGATGIREMLRTARDHELDILVVGRRLPHDQLGVGSAFYRLGRKSPCSVLVVPAGSHPHLSRLVVMVDGSEHSKLALETAVAIARSTGDARPQIVVQTVYSVRYGYRYGGLTIEQAGQQLEAVQRRKLNDFLAGLRTEGVELEVVYTCSDDPAAAVFDLAAARNMDAVVLGSRGATLPANALLGETAERILATAPLPVLIVKRKGETVRFLDALLATLQETG